jgi:lipopolysaccharide export system permease protein
MKIIERYILGRFILSFLWCLTIFFFLYIVIDLFGHMDEIIREQIGLATLLYYYLTFAPLIFVQTSPIAVLLATVYNLGNLNKNNEITAMKASGINVWKILRPILLVGLLISILTFMVNDKVVPQSTKVSTRLKEELIDKKKAANRKIIENVAIYGKRNRIIYARRFDVRTNELHDVVIHEHDLHQNLTLKISAAKASYRGGTWHFTDLIMSRLNNQGQLMDNPVFYEETMIDMPEKPEDFTRREWRTEFMNYKELYNYINLFKGGAQRTLNRLRVDLHYKLSFPLISFIIILVGAPFALHMRRGGVLAGIGVSVIISLLYYATSAILLACGKASILPPLVAAWAGNIIFGVFGFMQVQKLR